MTEVDPGPRVPAEACWVLSLGRLQRRSSLEGGKQAGQSGLHITVTLGARAVRAVEILAPILVPSPPPHKGTLSLPAGRCPQPPTPLPPLPLVFPGHLHHLLMQVTPTLS